MLNVLKPVPKPGNGSSLYVQKWVLQRRNSQGYFVQLGTYDTPISQEDVRKQFGDGYYVLRSCKPRFQTQWKTQIGTAKEDHSKETDQTRQLKSLEKKTKLLAVGVVATGAVEIVSLPLIHIRFSKIEDQIAQLKAVNQTISAQSLVCPNCHNNLGYMLQVFCSSCGVSLTWPRDQVPVQQLNPNGDCFRCHHQLLSSRTFCPNCGVFQGQFTSASKDGNL